MCFAIIVTVLVGYLLGNLNGAVCMSNLVAHEMSGIRAAATRD